MVQKVPTYITTNNAYPLAADSHGIHWDFSDIVLSCQMSRDYFCQLNLHQHAEHAMMRSGISWAAWAFLSHKDSGTSDHRAQHNKTLGFTWYGMGRGRKTAFNTVCAHAAASSLLPLPPTTISVSTHSSLAPLSPANFPISFRFLLPFSPSLLLFRHLAACSCQLAMSPVNPKVSLPLSAETSVHRNKQQLLFIFVSYNRRKGLASLWEPAALFPPLLPTQKSGFSTCCWGHTWHPAVTQGSLHPRK